MVESFAPAAVIRQICAKPISVQPGRLAEHRLWFRQAQPRFEIITHRAIQKALEDHYLSRAFSFLDAFSLPLTLLLIGRQPQGEQDSISIKRHHRKLDEILHTNHRQKLTHRTHCFYSSFFDQNWS
jgi:hypothetical protein